MAVWQTTGLRVSRAEGATHDLLEGGCLPGPADGDGPVLGHVPGHAAHPGHRDPHRELHHAAGVAVAGVIHQVTLVIKLKSRVYSKCLQRVLVMYERKNQKKQMLSGFPALILLNEAQSCF